MQFVSNRNVTLRSKSGHMIAFKAGVPMDVPQPVRRECMAIGIIPVDGKPDTVENLEAEVSRSAAVPPGLREALIFFALDRVRDENETSKFDAAGRPKVDAINSYFHGFLNINATDRGRFWDEYRALTSQGEEIPTHKDMNAFLEIAGVTSRDEVADHGKALGVDPILLDTLSVRDARRVLMNALLES